MFDTKKRIKGYDFARTLAVFIMVFVNFHMVLTKTTDKGTLTGFFSSLQGKGAALFIVLAGVGMSLMTKSSLAHNGKMKIKLLVLLKRAVFLFVFGLVYLPLWPADILHYYGFYISIGVLMITVRSVRLWIAMLSTVAIYPFILMLVNYDTGWNWETTEYIGFWTIKGFLRNLFVNGFHPVIPWVAFVFAGLWLGRQDMTNKNIRNLILWLAAGIFVLVQLSSQLLISATKLLVEIPHEDIVAIFGTHPMPPLPLYMISGVSLSFVIIILCIILTEKFRDKKWIDALVATGQMAFTHYVAHVVIGILGVYILFSKHSLSSLFTFLYALGFCIASVLFSWQWRSRFKKGPMSMLMRSITG